MTSALRLKDRLARNQVCRLFALARVLHPVVIDLFGLGDAYDGFWVDQEHASHGTEQLAGTFAAGRANQLDGFVRMPPTGYWQVTQCLEAGASGVMAAQIHTADQAREFVAWTRFAPLGCRGLNLSGYDAGYSHLAAEPFIEQANRDVLVGVQVETLGAVAAAAELAALEGVDFLFIGPADLSLALGVPGQFEHSKLWEAIDRVASACQQHGKHWGAVLPNPAFAARSLDAGCKLPTVGNDVQVLRRGIEALQQAFGPAFSERQAQP